MLRCGKVVGGDGQVETVASSRPPWRKNATFPSRLKSFRDSSTPAGHGRVLPRGPEDLGRGCSTICDSVKPRSVLG